MLTRFSMARLLLLLFAVYGFSAVPDCRADSKSLTSLQSIEASATTLTGTYERECALPVLRPDEQGQSLPSRTAANASTIDLQDEQEVGIPGHLSAVTDGFSPADDNSDTLDDALVGGMIGLANSFIFDRPYNGWQVEVDGDTRNFRLNLTLAW